MFYKLAYDRYIYSKTIRLYTTIELILFDSNLIDFNWIQFGQSTFIHSLTLFIYLFIYQLIYLFV